MEKFWVGSADKNFILNIRHGRSTLEGQAKLSIVLIELENIQSDGLLQLNSLSWNKSIVIDPHTDNEKLKIYALAISQDCLILSLPMEPHEYPYKKPGKNALFIHYNRNQIIELLDQKKATFASMSGFATLVGDRAIENKTILSHLFSYFSENNLCFLDLTQSQRSMAVSVSREFNVLCRKSAPKQITSDNVIFHLNTHIKRAIQRGESLFIVPFNKNTIQVIDGKLRKVLKTDKRLKMITFTELENS